MQLSLQIQRFLVPKTGHTDAECEDAEYVWQPETAALFAAIADGASESLLAGAWARRLVQDTVESMWHAAGWPDGWHGDLGPFVEDLMSRTAGNWDAYLDAYRADREARGKPIAWYEQPGLDKGAFATLLGVEVRGDCSWRAFALGDSCLVHVRDGLPVTSFPMTDAADFDVTPDLLGSRNRDTALVAERVTTAGGDLRAGDDLLLATDALAAWLLSADGNAKVLGAVADLGAEDFGDWVAEQRGRGAMRNDDVALVRLRRAPEDG